MKRSSDNANPESEAKRLHTGHSMRDVVMLLDDSDVSRAVERCREVCRRKGTFLVEVNDWDCEFRDKLRACGSDGTTVACSSGGVAKELMSNESRLLDFVAAARNSNGNLQGRTFAKCLRQHKCGTLWAVGHCEVRPNSSPSSQDGGSKSKPVSSPATGDGAARCQGGS